MNTPKPTAIYRDRKRAVLFWKYAREFADTATASGNEMKPYYCAFATYLNGLRHELGNVSVHQEIYELAKRRKAAGGPPADSRDRVWPWLIPREPVERVLYMELIWAKDPMNARCLRDLIQAVKKAHLCEREIDLSDLIQWLESLVAHSK